MAKKTKPGIELPSTDEGHNKLPPPISTGSGDVPAQAKSDTESPEDGAKRKRAEGVRQHAEDQKLIARAIKNFKRDAEAEAENRKAALEDLKFKAGQQWPADDQAQRNTDKRPCLTINKCPTLVHQVANDIRMNRPAINVSPLGDQATKEGAELYASMIRAIERDSAADIAYDTAVGSAVDMGFGYWRVLTEYESADSFDQVLVTRRVRNAFTVLADHARQEPDGCDMRHCFISEMVEREDFTDQWPGANPVSWSQTSIGTDFEPWATKDKIRVAEYFEVTHEHRRLVKLDTGHTGFYDDLGTDVKADIAAGAREIVDDRDAEVQRVDWYRLTCYEVLERRRWLGKWIPIIEVVGEEIDLEGKVIRSGVIRNAKDPMRMKNYWVTTKTELYALQPKAPWLAPEGSFEGYESDYDTANRKNITRLEYVPQVNEAGQPLPPPTRQPPPQIAAGLVEAEKSADQDVLATTGVRFDATLNERTYDESGKALRELRRSGDIGSFHFTDNFSRSLRHMGRILLDLIPKVYNRRRMVPTLAEDGKESRIMIDPDAARPVGKVASQQQGQEPIKVFNPKLGEYGVTITVGPSYATKRIEAQENMSKFIGQIPEQMRGVVAALMAKYSDWPGSTELWKALAKMVPPNIFAPDPANMPPEVATFVQGLTQQLKQLTAERQQMLRDLTDKKADQQIMRDKVNKDFEAKLLKLVADAQKACDRNDLEALRSVMGAENIIRNTLTGGSSTGNAVEQQPPMMPPVTQATPNAGARTFNA